MMKARDYDVTLRILGTDKIETRPTSRHRIVPGHRREHI